MRSRKSYKLDNDPENIIADTVKIIVKSTETTSNKLPNDLLRNLYQKTNVRNVNADQEFMANLIFTVYSCYKTLKGISDWNLEEDALKEVLISWHLLLGIECLRRDKMVHVKPFKILDFDSMGTTKMKLKIDETTWQSLMN